MSDQNKDKRERYRIEMEEHVDFPETASTAYVSSQEICSLASEIFKAAFADCEGTCFDVNQNGEPTLSIIFNHGSYDENAIVGCERAGGNKVGNSIVDRTRARDRQLTEGDRYYLTEDGKDVVLSLLLPRVYNNGKPNWKLVVSDYVEAVSSPYYQNQRPQYTKVAFIDLRRVCKLIYGNKDKNGGEIDYDVKIKSVLGNQGQYMMPGMNIKPDYLLEVTSVPFNAIKKVYEKLGYSFGGGDNIIR